MTHFKGPPGRWPEGVVAAASVCNLGPEYPVNLGEAIMIFGNLEALEDS